MKVMIIDLDPQGNASTGLGIGRGPEDRTPSTLDVLKETASLAQAARPTGIPRLSIVLGILGVGTFLGLLNPWFIQQLIDRILLEARPDLLWIFAAAILGAAAFRFGLGILQAWVYTAATSLVLLDMRRDFLEHLQRLRDCRLANAITHPAEIKDRPARRRRHADFGKRAIGRALPVPTAGEQAPDIVRLELMSGDIH